MSWQKRIIKKLLYLQIIKRNNMKIRFIPNLGLRNKICQNTLKSLILILTLFLKKQIIKEFIFHEI
jgi:hypothetical protein